MITITSKQNERYKAIAKQLSGRLPDGMAVLEGMRLVTDALQSGIRTGILVFSDDKAGVQASEMLAAAEAAERILLRPDLFKRLADTVSPQGVILIAPVPEYTLDTAAIANVRRVLVLDGLSDPGNVGSISRSAEAFGFDTIIYAKAGVSPLSRKAVRASMGSILRQQLIQADNSADVVKWLQQHGFALVALDAAGRPAGEMPVPDRRLALIVGNEAHGLSDAVRRADPALLQIPMQGRVESLNAAVAAAIAMYEIGK